MMLPHGIYDFEELVRKGYFYIDRTPYIEKLERSADRLVLFQRPEGFDRKLFISMLSCYYGIQYRKHFRKLFKRFYIGRRKTSQANGFHILTIDLSGINLTALPETEKTLTDAVVRGLERFVTHYKRDLTRSQHLFFNDETPEELLITFFQHCSKCNIYLFLDDQLGLIVDLIDPNSRREGYNLISKSLINRFLQTVKKKLAEETISRIMVLGIDESEDRGTSV